ncbi:GBS Bsp-like repeat-containing protein [Christensenella massiliensis]|uniref:GBS Bsp-like repeat-containing protein n=1 Tax=Christensenella massiliensis TaxID=1805714 RepID=A0AAU8A7S5_9FIRM
MKRGRRRLVAVLLCCLLVLSSATIALAEEAPAAPSEDTAAQIGDKTENITDEQEPGKEEDSAPIVEDGVAEEEEKIEETEKIEEKNETKDLPEKQEGPLLDSAQNTVDIVSKEAVDALILEPEARETEESDTKIPTLDHIEKSADPSKTAIFYVAAKGVTDDKSGVKSVEFAVWSEKNGQDDLKWYKGAKDGADSWSVGVNAANHKNDTGKYQIHVYATDNAGNRGLVGTSTVTLDHRDAKIPTLDHIEKSADPSKTAIFYVAAKGVTDDRSGVKSVEFAVWSEKNGQDDLKWYTGVKDGADSWSVGVNAANHKNDTGKYQIHVYATDNAGNRGLVGTSTVTLDHRDTKIPTLDHIEKSADPSKTAIFYVAAKDVMDDRSGVKSVEFAVWSEKNGQDDLKWYKGTKDGADSWSVGVSVLNHKMDTGKYQIHVYATDNAGNRGLVGTTTLVSDFVDNQAPTVAASNILNGDIYGGSKVIYLGGVSDQSGVKSVQAAIWGADYGQDDLKWYSLTNRGNGNWDMTLSLAEHGGPFFDEGIYNVHIYTEDVLGNRACVYTTDFYVEPAVASAGDAEVYYYDFFDSIWVYDISCSTGVSGVFYNFYNEYDDIYVEAHYTDFLTSGDLYLDDMIQPYGTCNLDVGVLDMRGRFYIVGQYYFTV